MGRRGRKSAAALSLIATVPDVAAPRGNRPAPPSDLTPEQAAEWRAIVARCPAGWFPRETYPLLEEYCRCVVSLRRLNKLLDRFATVDDEYERVFDLIERERRLLMSLATKMRLSQHATYDKKKSKGPTIEPPWED